MNKWNKNWILVGAIALLSTGCVDSYDDILEAIEPIQKQSLKLVQESETIRDWSDAQHQKNMKRCRKLNQNIVSAIDFAKENKSDIRSLMNRDLNNARKSRMLNEDQMASLNSLSSGSGDFFDKLRSNVASACKYIENPNVAAQTHLSGVYKSINTMINAVDTLKALSDPAEPDDSSEDEDEEAFHRIESNTERALASLNGRPASEHRGSDRASASRAEPTYPSSVAAHSGSAASATE